MTHPTPQVVPSEEGAGEPARALARAIPCEVCDTLHASAAGSAILPSCLSPPGPAAAGC